MPSNEPDSIGIAAENLLDVWIELRPIFARRCPPHTVELLRHAFYLGALGAFTMLVHNGAADESAEDGVARIEALHAELAAFRFDLRHVVPLPGER